MFLNTGKNPNKLKEIIYLTVATFLGLVLSLIVHAIIEMGYLSWADSKNLVVPFYGGCALPPSLQIGLWMIGAIGGFLAGRLWWRKVYIDKTWQNSKNLNKF